MSESRRMALSSHGRSQLSQGLLLCADLLAFNLGILLAVGAVQLIWGDLDRFIPPDEVQARLSAHFLLSLYFVGWCWTRLRHYSYRRPFWFELRDVLRALVILSIIDLAIVAFSKWQLSRYIWVFTWVSILVLVPLFRALMRKLLDRFGLWKKPCVIIGSKHNAADALMALQSEVYLGFDIQYFFSIDPDDDLKELNGVPVLHDEQALWRKSNRHATQYIIALEDDESAQQAYWIKRLAVRKCRAVSVVPTMRGIPLNSTDMSFIFRHEVFLLQINNNLTKKSARFLKRSFDIAGALVLLMLLSPVLLLLLVGVMKDGGNPIYGHMRVGRNGRRFRCLKFRSMVLDSQDRLNRLLASDPQARAEWEKDFKLKNDPRITGIGHFLRNTSLDELPQLWNVLKGEMSLVGPRPVTEDELARYGDDVDYYLMAKPGMTGLWQVSGRNDVDYSTRVYFDSWYVKNWSLWNDIAILFKTINVVLKRNGAY